MPATNSELTALVAKVSRPNLERDVRSLSTLWPNRHTWGKYLAPCGDWLATRFRQSGLTGVGFHEYTVGNRRARNVVGMKKGKTAKTILLCAHYDSRMQNLGDADSPAPGANDNGTGVAVVLEAARLLAPLPLSDTIRFVLFSGEEQGLLGSSAYATQLKRERLDVRFVFNLDELGFPPPDRALFVDKDMGNESRANDAASAALVARVQELAKTIVKVPTRVDPAENSDYMPFEAEGYVISGLYEAGKNYPSYHSTTDTFEKVDFAYVHAMARLTVATIYDAAKGA